MSIAVAAMVLLALLNGVGTRTFDCGPAPAWLAWLYWILVPIILVAPFGAALELGIRKGWRKSVSAIGAVSFAAVWLVATLLVMLITASSDCFH
ncbi:MAG TPA: hypothetical protein VH816_17185 [Gaiellaceae bacterium]|jgi:hypothetical protein